MLKLREHQCSKDAYMFWDRKETENLNVTLECGTLRTASDKIAAFLDWPLPKTREHIKHFVQFRDNYGQCIHHHCSDC